jgi:hypothetical protein
MPDQRQVGHAIRRRMGVPRNQMSHLGMAEANRGGSNWTGYPPSGEAALAQAEATARGNVSIPAAGGRSMESRGHIKGVPDVYETGSDTYGRGETPLAPDNAAFTSGVKAGVVAEPHPPRGRLSPGESAGARLTVSPSMKMPEQSPVPTQGGGRVVPSQSSRQGSFSTGQMEAGSG